LILKILHKIILFDIRMMANDSQYISFVCMIESISRRFKTMWNAAFVISGLKAQNNTRESPDQGIRTESNTFIDRLLINVYKCIIL